MASKTPEIDISENALRNRGRVLDILLLDRTRSTKSRPYNIIWATDSYMKHGKDYAPKKQIKREQITGTNGKLIQPRAAKSREEQKHRTKDKAEVFTPLEIVDQMNKSVESSLVFGSNHTWQDYIAAKWLEITCGEGPFIAGRYNPTADTGVVIRPANRVGFLDRKLQVVGKNAKSKKEWLNYAEVALKACYGYEWQGDNLLIARENILMTIDDFYKDFCISKLKLKSKQNLTDEQLEHFAEIISWNIWQMDGLKYVIPLSCRQVIQKPPEPPKNQLGLGLMPTEKPQKIKIECEGCRLSNPAVHSGKYAQIMDWEAGKKVQFVKLHLVKNSAPLQHLPRYPKL